MDRARPHLRRLAKVPRTAQPALVTAGHVLQPACNAPDKRRDRGFPAVPWWRRRESNPGPETPCSCHYVCSRRTVLPRTAPVGGLVPTLVTCLTFALRPVTRRSASQLADALPEALAGLPVERHSDLRVRQRERLRYRSQLLLPERIYVDLGRPRHAAKSSASPSKPIAPEGGSSEVGASYGLRPSSQGAQRPRLRPLWHPPAVRPTVGCNDRVRQEHHPPCEAPRAPSPGRAGTSLADLRARVAMPMLGSVYALVRYYGGRGRAPTLPLPRRFLRRSSCPSRSEVPG